MNIRTKMLIIILATTSVIYITAIGFISLRHRSMAMENAISLTDEAAREYANSVETSLNEDIAVARTMAQAFSGYRSIDPGIRDEIYDGILLNVLKSNPRYIAVFLQWELNAIIPGYEKPYGRLRKSASWIHPDKPRNTENLRWKEDTLEEEGDDTTGIYYLSKSQHLEIITNPYFYSYSIDEALPSDIPVKSDDILESTIIIPIIIEHRFVGMAGMDIPLNSFQEIIDGIKPFDDSYSFLVANDGSFVAHPMLKDIQGSIVEIGSIYPEVPEIYDRIISGEPLSFRNKDKNGREFYVTIVPVIIGNTGTPWAMGIAIPLDIILAEALRNFYITLFVGIIGLMALALVIWLISVSITKPITATTTVLKALARGKVDDTMVQEVKSSDEIGEMTASANTLVDFLRTTASFAKQIGEGNLQAGYSILSKEDLLGKALIEMRDKLKSSNEKITAQSEILIKTNRELEKLSLVASKTDNAVLIMDPAGRLEWVNEGLKRLYGYTFEEYVAEKGGHFFDVSSNPEARNLFRHCTDNKVTVSYISENMSSSGKTFWAQTTLTPIVDDLGKVIKLIAIDSDITKLKHAEEEIGRYAAEVEKHRDTLEELNATKDRFFAIIAHDLKNPFAALISMTNSLHSTYQSLEEEDRLLYIAHIKKLTARIYALLDNLLLWATSQTGRIKFSPAEIRLTDISREACRLTQVMASEKDIVIENAVPENTIVYADENMISTVVRNLVTNAIKYSNKGGKVIVEAKSTIKEDGISFTEVSVSDEGIGMDSRLMNKLFRIDMNPSTPGTADEKGSGLGLIICKDFIEKNGGRIWVESETAKGSIFHFSVPSAAKT